MAQALYFPLLLIALCSVSECVQRRCRFVDGRENWTGARRCCGEGCTDLATVDGMDGMVQLNKSVNVNYGVFWIGLQGTDDSRWRWSSGDPVLFLSWASGQPHSGDNCAVMTGGGWFVGACTATWTFICYNMSRGLVFVGRAVGWRDARGCCGRSHVDLVGVGSRGGSQQLERFIGDGQTSGSSVWIGLFGDTWRWSDRSNSSFRYWKTGEPRSQTNEHRAAVEQIVQGQWSIYMSNITNNQYPFVCHEGERMLRARSVHRRLRISWSWLCMSDVADSSAVFVLRVVVGRSLSGFCFVLCPDGLIVVRRTGSWSGALRCCGRSRVGLVSVQSVEMQRRVVNVVGLASAGAVWLGFASLLCFGHLVLGGWTDRVLSGLGSGERRIGGGLWARGGIWSGSVWGGSDLDQPSWG